MATTKKTDQKHTSRFSGPELDGVEPANKPDAKLSEKFFSQFGS